MKICPHCKQPIVPDFFLPPVKAKIFEIIKANPGITIRDITAKFSRKTVPATIRQHILQLNKRLAGTGVRISCGFKAGGKGQYRIVHQHEEATSESEIPYAERQRQAS